MQIKTRKLCIVLLDLIGSTQFVQRVGHTKAAAWLQYHDRLTRSLMFKFSGREIDRSDGFLISFEETINAVNFALHYQSTIPDKTRLNTRIGIHVGTVAEVTQRELDVMVGAKPVELEGVAKNLTARVMSVCAAGQVLLTSEAFAAVKNKTNRDTPRHTRYAQVGLYKFKGIAGARVIYAVVSNIRSLQPPPSSEKAKRLGGPSRIKSHARDRRLIEWFWWSLPRLAIINAIYIIFVLWPYLSTHWPPLRFVVMIVKRVLND